MTEDQRLEQVLGGLLTEELPTHAPERLRHHVLFTTSRVRPRSRWLALIKERPMRVHNQLAVGSPTLRLASIALLTLLLALLATATVVGAATLMPGPATIIVAQDGSGTVRTIQEAVSLATDGDTVLVRPGIYPESLLIEHDITLRGDGNRTAIVLDVSSSSSTTELPDLERPVPYGILLDGSDGTIDNLSIRGPGEGIGVKAIGGAPTLERLTIEMGTPSGSVSRDFFMPVGFLGGSTGTISGSVLRGYIPVRGASPLFVDNTIDGYVSIDGPGAPVVRGNQFVAAASVGTSFGGSALIEANEFAQGWISADTGSDPTIRGNIIRSSNAGTYDCAAICISQYGSGLTPAAIAAAGLTQADLDEIRAVIQGNQIANSDVAIGVNGAGAATVIGGNAIRDNGTGISISNGATGLVQDNDLSRNTAGIKVGGDAAISGNTIRESANTGLVIVIGSPHVTGNHIESGKTGISVNKAATATLRDNVVCGNEVDIRVGGVPTDALDGVTLCALDPGVASPAS